MLKKTRSKDTANVKVTFVLGSEADADHVHLVGDFNDWQNTTPMKRQKDGTWRATVDLSPGTEFQFRYLVNGNVWVNDEAADGYVPGPFGADNSVVRTPDGARVGVGRATEGATAAAGPRRGGARGAGRGPASRD